MSDTFIDLISRSGFRVHAVEVLSEGVPTVHHAFDGDIRFPVYSITKSVTSSAFSLARDDGLVSPDMPLAEFLERRYRSEMPAGFSDMPFSRFLTMTAGKYPFRPEGSDWISGILSLGTDYSDRAYHYSNIPAYLVGAAVENAVGGGLAGYLQRRLFDPLGIPEPKFLTSPEGHFYGATGMELTVHELALLGELYRRGGEWQGERLISESSVSDAVAEHVRICSDGGENTVLAGFGYYFRVFADRFEMGGKWGQRCCVYPERKLVVAWLADEPERSEALSQMMYCAINDAFR